MENEIEEVTQENIDLVWKVLAILGGHRLFSGNIKKSILFYLSAGGLLVWWVLDVVAMFKGSYFAANYKPAWAQPKFMWIYVALVRLSACAR